MLADCNRRSYTAPPAGPGTPHQFIRQHQRSLIQVCPQLRAPSLSVLQVIDHDGRQLAPLSGGPSLKRIELALAPFPLWLVARDERWRIQGVTPDGIKAKLG